MNSIKLKPCPFCGRKMVFYKETYKNMHGRQCTRQYYMHEDYDINQEESCILDDIDMPFTIGAGDARLDTGNIGEYGEKWNRRTAEVKVMNDEAEQILKKVAEHYGYVLQREQFVEECAEAVLAVQKCKRGKDGAFENFKEEIADVLIMAEQMRYFIGEYAVDKIINAKLHRQLQRIEEENNG